MRVSSGSARGLRLKVPRVGVRPTMERVKGAIFSSLHDVIPGARVLDLFAGSGSLGIEALSRGAASVVFVENDQPAVAVIRENLAKARLSGEIHALDVFSYLDRIAPAGSFDLIIADPPYAKAPGERDFGAELLGNVALIRALTPNGIFVLEHLPDVAVKTPATLECFRDKNYGATAVAFFRRAEPSP
ncbi:MAG: 16S rRNA (guanine(966)-N(2))-methyltransferase RsmD [Chthoniobacteraceae bacterium]